MNKKTSATKRAILWFLAVALSATGLTSASANAPVPVGATQLSFVTATVERLASPSQQDQGPTTQTTGNQQDVGNNLKVGDRLKYTNVATLNSIQIDALVTIQEVVQLRATDPANTGEDNGTDPRAAHTGQDTSGHIRLLDRGSSNGTEIKYISTSFASVTGSSGLAYVTYEIAFFTGGWNESNRIGLNGLQLSIYDIDAGQFFESSAHSTHLLSNPTVLDVSTNGSFTRFADPLNTGVGSPASENENRVTLKYPDNTQRFSVRMGQLSISNSGSSGSFDLDFSAGANFTNTPVETNSPVLVSQTPRSVPYEGPLNLRNQSGSLCSNGEGVLTGERLNTISEIYIGDKKVAQELLSDGRLKYSLKDIAPGTYQIRYWVPVNSVNLTDQIRVGTCSTTPAVTTPGAFEANKLFANYRGDRGPVIARDRAAITAFINQYKGITSVKCVGSTSGVPAKRTDPALAQARAKNACDIVKTLVPNATYTLETSTGKGVGQRFRSVTIFISGTN